MKKIVLYFVLYLVVINAKAQVNLIPNYSFEDTINCNENNYSLEDLIFNWWGGKGYYNSCRANDFSIPGNISGHQQPRTGNAYCGVYTRANGTVPLRNYIQVKLNQPLHLNYKYKVEFYVSLGDTMHAYCNSIGAFFSPDSFLVTLNNFLIDQTPQIQNTAENILNNKIDWILICDSFVANGNEKWLTIGNFYNDSLSALLPLDSVCSLTIPYNCAAYYYIDDVSVTLIDETGIDEQNKNSFSLFPNPNSGTFRLQYKGIIVKPLILKITDVYGKLIDTKEIFNTNTDYENISLNNGLYFYTIWQGVVEVGRGKFLIVK